MVALSHSGQTFPSLHATAILEKQCPGRVFVVTGSFDSKMAAVVGQKMDPGAPFGCRVFSTGAGWRSAEPASVSALAMHHLLTELLLSMAASVSAGATVQRRGGDAPPPDERLGLRLSAQDVADLSTMRDRFVRESVPQLTGVTATGEVALDPGGAHAALLAQGRAWGWNILEAPLVWAAHATYITLAVVFGWPLFRSMLQLGLRSESDSLGYHYSFLRPDWVAADWLRDGSPSWRAAVYYVAGFLDSALFIFFPALVTLALRAVQGRQLLARVKGRRTLVIADVPWVHQLLEIYTSKLFALSYAIAGLDVHGANPVDHLVHRFTHRVARGAAPPASLVAQDGHMLRAQCRLQPFRTAVIPRRSHAGRRPPRWQTVQPHQARELGVDGAAAGGFDRLGGCFLSRESCCRAL